MSGSQTALRERPTGENEPRVEADKTISVADQVLAKLSTLVEPEEGLRWLAAPQEDFGVSPMELIERGRADIVLHMLIRLEEGIHV